MSSLPLFSMEKPRVLNLLLQQLMSMEYEKLALEVRAHKAGLSVIKPPFVVGSSGVRHRFTFLASEGPALSAFDICEQVGVMEVIRTYAKKLDTGVAACIVNLGARIDSEISRLASSYGIDILGPGDIQNCFKCEIGVPSLA
jgi:hypothetical protein